jgi:hypothetical protein
MGGVADVITEKQRIILGFRPRTLAGVWFWFRYCSAIGRALGRVWR